MKDEDIKIKVVHQRTICKQAYLLLENNDYVLGFVLILISYLFLLYL